jgi:hypothetical protein
MDDLGKAAATIAMRAAAEYLSAHGLKADTDDLTACLRSWIKAKLPEALADAKAALDCGMTEIATQTFGVTIALAGIEAAKEAGFPV